jgi:sugar O-acyltransferase (sialic acid O-acetyltransferase NeuD family)
MNKEKLAIIGYQEGMAGQISDLIESEIKSNYDVYCFIHPYEKMPEINQINRATSFFNYPIFKNGNWFFKGKPLIVKRDWISFIKKSNINNILITIDDQVLRKKIIMEGKKAYINLINYIHPSSVIFPGVKLHNSIIILANCVIGYNTEIYDGVIINNSCNIDHHNVIEEFVTIDPGVTTAGNVLIKEYACIHTSATLINKINIGKNAIVGAGAVVIRDVSDNTTVIGVPAKPLLKNTSIIK